MSQGSLKMQPVQERTKRIVAPADNVVVPGHGSSQQIAALANRILSLVDVEEDERAPAMNAAMKAAQMCVSYGFVPGVDVHLYRDGKDWVADAGLRAWVESANRLAQRLRFTWLFDEIEMTADEVRDAVRDAGRQYTDGDRGWFCRVVRSDKLTLAKEMGASYDPPYSVGLWLAKARQELTDREAQWFPDPVYKQRDASYTARLRAQKAALMVEFTLSASNDSAAYDKAMLHIGAELNEREQRAKYAERDSVMYAPKPLNMDDEGNVWA